MKRPFLVLAGSMILAGCGSVSDEVGPSDDGMDKFRQAAWVEKGKEAIKAKLKDPDSAQFRNVNFFSGGGVPTACGEVNAKNGFGGYSGFERFIAAGDAIAFTESQIEGGLGPAWDKYCIAGPDDFR